MISTVFTVAFTLGATNTPLEAATAGTTVVGHVTSMDVGPSVAGEHVTVLVVGGSAGEVVGLVSSDAGLGHEDQSSDDEVGEIETHLAASFRVGSGGMRVLGLARRAGEQRGDGIVQS